MDFDKVFTAFRNCISEPKCKDCPWEQCEQFNQKKVSIPITLALDVLNLLKERDAREPHYTTLRYLVNGMEVAIQHPECPRCIENGLALWDAEIEKGQAYCKRCGQVVKWDD